MTKTANRSATIAVRNDGVTVSLREPTRKFSPPHDLVHFVVEKNLSIRDGFWGSIADGAKFSSLRVVDGRQKPKANERSAAVIKANTKGLSNAEVIVGVFQRVLHEDLKPPLRQLESLLRRAGVDRDPDDIERTWLELISLRDAWEALAVGDTIALMWPEYTSRKAKSRRS